MILCDTDVLINALRGKSSTQDLFASLTFSELSISAITEMELYRGARDKRELVLINRHVQSFAILDITPEISRLARDLVFRYAKSHHLQIPDALIAATAITSDAQLLTQNIKDFRFIPALRLYVRKDR